MTNDPEKERLILQARQLDLNQQQIEMLFSVARSVAAAHKAHPYDVVQSLLTTIQNQDLDASCLSDPTETSDTA
jgi:hypothetical protein